MSYSALIEANRAKAMAQPRTHACVICGKITSIVRPVCEVCIRD